MRNQRPDLVDKDSIRTGQHPALTGGDVLGREKGETADPERTRLLSPPSRAERLGTVFDEKQIVLFAEVNYRVHLARLSTVMNADYRLRVRGNLRRN